MSDHQPKIPYLIDLNEQLHFHVFLKESSTLEQVDEVVACFIEKIMAKSLSSRKEIVYWRGEYTNASGVSMWSVGIPSKYAQKLHAVLTDCVYPLSDDYGSGPTNRNGCKPYLLLTPGKVWQFDARKPPGSEGTLDLAGKSFPVSYLPYKPKGIRQKMAAEHDSTELFPYLDEIIADLEAGLTDSVIENWFRIQEVFEAILKENRGDFDYGFLRRFCRALSLPMAELPIQENGRIAVHPIWEDRGEGYGLKDFSVRVAINKDLSQSNKLMALAHELGHFVHHLMFYIFFARLQSFVELSSGFEIQVAERLTPDWWQAYYLTTELRADLTASYFVVPSGAARAWTESYYSSNPLTPEIHEYIWLKRLEDENPEISGARLSRYIEDAQKEIKKIESSEYDPHAPLFERVAWCTFHRSKPDLQSELERRESEIQSLFDIFEQEYKQGPLHIDTPQAKTSKQLYRRVTLDEVQSIFWDEEMWDPVIVESTAKSLQGYIGLIPRWLPRDRWEPIDWVVSFEPYGDMPGDLETWMEIAERESRGLMLYPLDPLERYARRKQEEMLRPENLTSYLQSLLLEEDEDG